MKTGACVGLNTLAEGLGFLINSKFTNITSLQTQTADLNRQLQAATAKIDHFTAYHKIFKQTGAECVEQIQHDRDKIKELEAGLGRLRKSHGSKILSLLLCLHELWNEPGHITLASSSPASFVEFSASSRPVQTEELPEADTRSQQSTLIDSEDLINLSE
ncbi:uncharacterized protein TrAtP1_009922 [Trichoderma atroviride]|uniref:Uncharacterized protein n=1 Tax=Hypocrea atroviridis (strain ATCC 20476 / IMI 206040) TaxID=452589 RepID=G9NEC6_HYPAI|nr:uncharacterized protein TRIATDRAFT_313973 [Trichoderma atroviride IMI 206040]EHK51032.1 hypothetical protein TRIATDRAFT_313973 [Trichoderma atroviride IMI 206040]UKZ68904.1 hypothetical protein TrAtP1_009922 [Trichoderma atroviride]